MRRYLIPALVAGIVGAIIGPVLGPALARWMRPVAKTGIKTGILLYEGAVTKAAELSETIDDLASEARAEIHDQSSSN